MLEQLEQLDWKLKLVLALVVLLLLSGGGIYYFYSQYQEAREESKRLDPARLRQLIAEDNKRLVTEIGKLIDLPSEDPTIATVTDPERLKVQPFFSKAKSGDRLLIFPNARKAILYDPAAKKVLEVAPLNIGTSSAAVSTLVKIALRNGTQVAGLTNRVEPEIKKIFPRAEITDRQNARRLDYDESLVVVLFPSATDEGNRLAKDLGLSVGVLPEGEVRPDNADLLVILGRDKVSQ